MLSMMLILSVGDRHEAEVRTLQPGNVAARVALGRL